MEQIGHFCGAVAECIPHCRRRQNATHRHCRVGHAFGAGHKVRLNPKRFKRKRRAHATETGNNLIKNHQNAVRIADFTQAFQIANRRWEHPASARNRFNNNRRNRLSAM